MFGFDRRYVLLPVLAMIAMILVGYMVARQSELNLTRTRIQMHDVGVRQQSTDDLLELMLNAETGQRGYVITGDESFLEPYQRTINTRADIVQRLLDAYEGDEAFAAQMKQIDGLVAKRFAQLADVVRLRSRSLDQAAEYIRARQGKATMDEFRQAIAALSSANQAQFAVLRDAETHDVTVLRQAIGAGAALTILLVVAGGLLVTRDLRRRALAAGQLQRVNVELESQVHAQTSDLVELSTHLQEVTERERSALARELHDELGGLLTAAKMDVAWLQQRIPRGEDPSSRWARLTAVLDAGVDLKRRLVEQLRPSLLDNMGLMAALRWQLQEACGRSGLQCTEDLPEEELELDSDAAIALFRIAQEAMTNVLKHAHATRVYVGIVVEDQILELVIRDDGQGSQGGSPRASHGITGMRHRAETLGGTWRAAPDENGQGTEITVRVPLARILKKSEADPLLAAS